MFPNNLQTLKVLSAQDMQLKIELMKLDAFMQRFLPGQELSGQVVKSLPGNRAVVQFAGEQVLLEMDRPARAGESFSAKVEGTHPSPTLRRIEPPLSKSGRNVQSESQTVKENSQPNDKVRLQRPQSKPIPSEQTFTQKQVKEFGIKPEQKIDVTVTRVIDQNTVAVKVKNQSVIARVPNGLGLNLKEGQSLMGVFRPIGNTGNYALHIETPSTGVLSASNLQEYLPARTALSNTLSILNRTLGELSPQMKESLPPDLLARLKTSTESLFVKDAAGIDAAAIKEQVSRSGINYESHLRNTLIGDKGVHLPLESLKSDVKGQLLSLSNHLANAFKEDGGVLNEMRNLAGQVRSAIQNIELQQLSQNLARQENQPMVLQIPNQLFGEDHTVQLFVRQDRDSEGSEGSKEKKSWNLVFFLDLTALGSIRVDTQVREQQVEVKISAEKESILNFLEKRFSEFENKLGEMGFHAEITGALANREDMELVDPLENHIKTDPNRLVDIKT